jgi:hypothetical protein
MRAPGGDVVMMVPPPLHAFRRMLRPLPLAVNSPISCKPRKKPKQPAGHQGNFPQAFSHLALIKAPGAYDRP